MTDTWNPSDHIFSTLSSGNKLATGNNATDGLARSILSKSTGKVYFEGISTWANVNSSFGMCKSSVTTAGNVGGPTPDGGFTINRNGNVFYNNVILFSMPGWSNGVLICYAVDLGAQLFWIRFGTSGLWNNDALADPATGTNGKSFSTTTLPLYVACTVANVDSTSIVSDTVAGTPPSGFSVWDPAVSDIAIQTAVSMM